MNQKTLGTLIAVAVIATGAAWFAARSSDEVQLETKNGDYLFPGLLAKVNDVAKLEVTNKDGKFAIEKKGDIWGMADKGGYPSNPDKVKELVVTIAQAQIVEKKTAKPENYGALDVQDVTVKDSGASQVKLFDKDSKELAAVLIGKPHNTKGFGGEYAMYARKVGDPQAYEVTGRVFVDATATNWLDKQIVKLEKTRVRSVLTKHPDGTTLEIHKNVPEDQAFSVTDLPAGEELKWNGVADGIAAALEWLNFEDVAPAASVDLTGLTPTETTFTTWDGMVLTAKLYEKGADKDAKSYLVLNSTFDEAKRFKKPEVVGPPPADAAKDPTKDEKKDATTPPEKKDEFVGKSPEDVKKEVDELNTRSTQWTYSIPGYSASNFKKTMKDLLKDKTPPPTAAPTDDPGALTSPLATPPTEVKKPDAAQTPPTGGDAKTPDKKDGGGAPAPEKKDGGGR